MSSRWRRPTAQPCHGLPKYRTRGAPTCRHAASIRSAPKDCAAPSGSALHSQPGGNHMEWKIVGINFLYAALGVLLMYMSYRVIDWLMPQVDFPEELKRGNIAV